MPQTSSSSNIGRLSKNGPLFAGITAPAAEIEPRQGVMPGKAGGKSGKPAEIQARTLTDSPLGNGAVSSTLAFRVGVSVGKASDFRDS